MYFNDLHDVLHEKLETIHKTQAEIPIASPICSQVCLAIAIQYMSDVSLWDIHDNFGFSFCGFTVHWGGQSTQSIVRVTFILIPITKSHWRKLKLGLQENLDIVFFIVLLGETDGCLIWQRNPVWTWTISIGITEQEKRTMQFS